MKYKNINAINFIKSMKLSIKLSRLSEQMMMKIYERDLVLNNTNKQNKYL